MKRLDSPPTLQTLLAVRGVHPDPGGGYAMYVERMEARLRSPRRDRFGLVPTCMHAALGRMMSVMRFWR